MPLEAVRGVNWYIIDYMLGRMNDLEINVINSRRINIANEVNTCGAIQTGNSFSCWRGSRQNQCNIDWIKL